jgi:hypothetical protein
MELSKRPICHSRGPEGPGGGGEAGGPRADRARGTGQRFARWQQRRDTIPRHAWSDRVHAQFSQFRGSYLSSRSFGKKTTLVSLLRCDERMLVTPYLTSMTTPESPGLLVEGATTSWFQVYLREFNYSFERAGPAWRPAVASALRPPRRGTHHRALGACVAQDTTHTTYQTAVELNRPRDM